MSDTLESHHENRRPLQVREAAWAKAWAARLAEAGVKPDTISMASVALAVLGGSLLLIAGGVPSGPRVVVLVLAALCIQGRLICNLLDGLVAVEHGKGSPVGPIWNELPDRVADVLLLACAGYGARTAGIVGADALGWIAAVLAVVTAYVRELGRGLGQPTDFSGPLAKPQRMAVLTAACVVAIFEPLWKGQGQVMTLALAVIAIGTLWTVIRRTRRLAMALSDNAPLSPADADET